MKDDLRKYPLSPDQAFQTEGTPGIPGLKGEQFNVEFKDPYYPYPKPGELYEAGKMEKLPAYVNHLAQLRGSTKPIGEVHISGGIGGDFDVDKFKSIWGKGEFKWFEPKFSERMGFVDFAKEGKGFTEYIGTYPRKMLLLL